MANTNKTKAEILQELESIKGLLLEEDDIPILQDSEVIEDESFNKPASPYTRHESVLPGQGSLFGEQGPSFKNSYANHTIPDFTAAHISSTVDPKHPNFASSLNNSNNHSSTSRPLAKAAGENPFLPQHIRERLHGNNPPPLFEYETAKKIISATKSTSHKVGKPRQHLIDDVIRSMMPQIESELRHRLFAMDVEDLERLLNEDD